MSGLMSLMPMIGTAAGYFFGGPVGGAIGGLIGSAVGGQLNPAAPAAAAAPAPLAAPTVPAPVAMASPLPTSQTAQEVQRASLLAQMQSQGRAATILTPQGVTKTGGTATANTLGGS